MLFVSVTASSTSIGVRAECISPTQRPDQSPSHSIVSIVSDASATGGSPYEYAASSRFRCDCPECMPWINRPDQSPSHSIVSYTNAIGGSLYEYAASSSSSCDCPHCIPWTNRPDQSPSHSPYSDANATVGNHSEFDLDSRDSVTEDFSQDGAGVDHHNRSCKYIHDFTLFREIVTTQFSNSVPLSVYSFKHSTLFLITYIRHLQISH